MTSRRSFLRGLLALPGLAAVPAVAAQPAHAKKWADIRALRNFSPADEADIKRLRVTNRIYIDGREVANGTVRLMREHARESAKRYFAK